jgi:hypothetical protein
LPRTAQRILLRMLCQAGLLSGPSVRTKKGTTARSGQATWWRNYALWFSAHRRWPKRLGHERRTYHYGHDLMGAQHNAQTSRATHKAQ